MIEQSGNLANCLFNLFDSEKGNLKTFLILQDGLQLYIVTVSGLLAVKGEIIK